MKIFEKVSDLFKTIIIIFLSFINLKISKKVYLILFRDTEKQKLDFDIWQLQIIRNKYYLSLILSALLLFMISIIVIKIISPICISSKIIIGYISSIILLPRLFTQMMLSVNSFPVNTNGAYFFKITNNLSTIIGIIVGIFAIFI